MSDYEAVVRWHAEDADSFLSRRYSRIHRWSFDGGAEVMASASPHIVRAPFADPAGIDPEEALVASLASCHMLFFLDLASSAGIDVVAYEDHAIGAMGLRADGRNAMARVTLRPSVEVSGATDVADMAKIHHQAHELCYIANSVNFPVLVEPVV